MMDSSIVSFKCIVAVNSSAIILPTGMPVQAATVSATA